MSVTFRHMDSSDALRKYAEEKSERVAKFLSPPVEIHWVLSVEKIRHIADAVISANGVSIKAQEATEDMYSAIDNVLDKLYIQVKKHKDRVKGHKNGETVSAAASYGAASSEGAPFDVDSRSHRIIKRENQFLKPMSVEEAAMQLDVTDSEFLIFTDHTTSSVSVIYKKTGGDYGLIETRTR
ncbi:MAG: ribosome hibernation-promoting factor, HPF/YfiA family [Thermodesulfobacteriota bacterium]